MNMTYEQIKAIIAGYVAEAKQADPTYTPSVEELTGMVKKIGLQKIIDTDYLDDLPELDGENLPLGSTIEEAFQDLIAPQDYSDQRDLNNHYPSYRPATYSYDLGRKTFTETRPLYAIQEACLNEEMFANLGALMYKRLYDSRAIFKYGCKIQLLKNWIAKVDAAMTAATEYATSKKYDVGDFIKSTDALTSAVTYAIVFRPIAATNDKTFAELMTAGTITPFNCEETLADITDTESGEAFVKAVKVAVEKSQVMFNNGNNLSGAQLGKVPELLLVIKQGIMPTLEVDVQAGAFNKDGVALPAKIKRVKELGDGVAAVLFDPRGCKLHSAWEQVITEGPYHDTANIDTTLHTKNTGFISPNAFVHVFKVS